MARSVFTHHLIEGIRSGAADTDGDGKISVAEISGYLSDRVPKDAIGQLPELSSRKTSGTFIVARNLRVIEERERVRAAEAAAERARERAALRGAAVAKLREHVNFGSIDMDFAGSVQSWLDAHPTEAVDHPRLALLRDFSENRLSAIKFHDRWHAAAAPDQAPAAPPDPAPVQSVWRSGGAEPKRPAEPVGVAAEPEPKVSVEPEPARFASGSTAAGGAKAETAARGPGWAGSFDSRGRGAVGRTETLVAGRAGRGLLLRGRLARGYDRSFRPGDLYVSGCHRGCGRLVAFRARTVVRVRRFLSSRSSSLMPRMW